MAYTVTQDADAPPAGGSSSSGGYTVAPLASSDLSNTPLSIPPWALAISGVTGIDPVWLSQHPDELKSLARQGGLTARYLLQGALKVPNLPADLYVAIHNRLSSSPLMSPSEAESQLLTMAGFPEPQTGSERVAQAISE